MDGIPYLSEALGLAGSGLSLAYHDATGALPGVVGAFTNTVLPAAGATAGWISDTGGAAVGYAVDHPIQTIATGVMIAQPELAPAMIAIMTLADAQQCYASSGGAGAAACTATAAAMNVLPGGGELAALKRPGLEIAEDAVETACGSALSGYERDLGAARIAGSVKHDATAPTEGFGPFHRRAAAHTDDEMQAAREDTLTRLEGETNQHGHAPSVDAFVGSLPEGVEGYEFWTPVEPRPGTPPWHAQWPEGWPGVEKINVGRVAIPVRVSRTWFK